jgi:16S rRNA (uracil1498-N3)-methyltransferase
MLYEDTHVKSKPVKNYSEPDSESIKNIFILVGSEGGFSSSEVDASVDCGYEILSLGSQILRVETACVASISILKSVYGLW